VSTPVWTRRCRSGIDWLPWPTRWVARPGWGTVPPSRRRSPPRRIRPSSCRARAGRRCGPPSWSPGVAAAGCGGDDQRWL
jgi:hypothetical protein